MKCQACQKQEATVILATGPSQKLWLCQDCLESRVPASVLEKIKAARERGDGAISGWTSYQPPPSK